MKGFDYSVIRENPLYDYLRPLGYLVRGCNYKVKYVGLENIPEEGGFILAANHVDALDPVYIALGVKNRKIHYMGKKELWENGFTRWLFTAAGSFPIVRGGADSEALNYAIRLVKEGYILGIFPEGTRSKDYKPNKAKSGVAVIARAAHSDILPVSIYTEDEMKKHTKLTIRFGEIIPYEKLGLSDDSSREEIKNAAAFVMDEIKKLWEEGHCE